MLNFAPWNQMLHQYVNPQGRVDYRTWKESAHQLDDWLKDVTTIDPRLLPDPDHQLAFWMNLYNALVIQQVLSQYPIASIQRPILGVPNWMAFFWFFWHPVCRLGDRKYSLNDIEHRVLRPLGDPRIHFALVCAAIGCPLLRNQSYFPETVQAQLEEDADRFINNPEKVRYDAASQTLYCSKIFKWYRQDFLAVADSIPEYIQPYRAFPDPFPDPLSVKYLNYDWGLNQRMSS
jgi:hypothetical protein